MSVRDVLAEALLKLRQTESELFAADNARPYDPAVAALMQERVDFYRRKVADLAEKLIKLN